MACTATWSQVLTYELELRKAAYRFARDGKSSCLNSAIEKAIDSTDLLNLHFIIAMTLGKEQSCPGEEEVAAPPPPAPHPAGRGSKGSGKSKQMPSWERQWGKAARTPEGKLICFKFNKPSGCAAGKNCRFEHVCQRCFHRHPFFECRYKRASAMQSSWAKVWETSAMSDYLLMARPARRRLRWGMFPRAWLSRKILPSVADKTVKKLLVCVKSILQTCRTQFRLKIGTGSVLVKACGSRVALKWLKTVLMRTKMATSSHSWEMESGAGGPR